MAIRAATVGPEQWCEAALLALGEMGPSALAVEPLALRLGVTKGSFYWHFRDRAALVHAVGVFWEARATTEVIAMLSTLEDPQERVVALFRHALDRVDQLRAERALMACASSLGLEELVARVHTRRHAFLVACFREMGMAPKGGEHRATLVYSTYLGALQLAGTSLLSTDRDLHAWSREVERMLLTVNVREIKLAVKKRPVNGDVK